MKGKITKGEERQRKLAAALMIGAMGAVTAEPAFAQQLQQVSADERIAFDIASQPLSSALSEFARQANVNALYFSDDLRGVSSPPLRGAFTRQEALDQLLARSGYSGRISGANLVLIQDTPRPQRESAASGAAETDRLGADQALNAEAEADEEIGWSIALRGMPGTDAAGASGLRDTVDAHLGRVAFASLLSGALSVAANSAEDDDSDRLSESVGDAAAQEAARVGARIVNRELNVRPTLRVRAGAPVRVLVSQDIVLRPYPR